MNPQIIYASITGISENVDKKYYDVIAQADSGIISINGEDDDMKISTSIVDAFSGMKLAYAISSALYAREKTKSGCKITVSMKGSAFDLLEQNLIAASISKENPQKVGNMDNAIAPFGVFKTKDSAVVIAIGNENQWKVFESFLRKNNKFFPADIYASNHLRLQNIKKLKIEIENILRKYSCDDAVKILEALRIPCAKVKTMVDVADDQENYEEKLLEKINHPVAGEIVVSSGGIFFSEFKKDKYTKAPKLKVKRRV
ncbi:MAG: CoA transferase [bacterium]